MGGPYEEKMNQIMNMPRPRNDRLLHTLSANRPVKGGRDFGKSLSVLIVNNTQEYLRVLSNQN